MSNMHLHTEATIAVNFKQLKVGSPAFENEGMIPEKYTCDGKNISPPLTIEHIPEDAKCLVLVVDDPDAPRGVWVHWVVWNIPLTHQIKEGVIHGEQGINDFASYVYGGPCPPSGTHRYFFKVYALDVLLDLPVNTNKAKLEKAMCGHIVAFGELVGLYRRTNK